MCLGVPMKIVSKDGDSFIAEVDGVQREASSMLLGEEVAVGDYVIVHAGLPFQNWMKNMPKRRFA